MNTEMNFPLTNVSTEAANDPDYASPGAVGKIDRMCRTVAAVAVLLGAVSGQIVIPAVIFAAAVLGCYLTLTAMTGVDPFYAFVGNHPWKRLASVSALSLGAVLSGQIYVPEAISALGFVGAITGLAAILHAGSSSVSRDKVDPIASNVSTVAVNEFDPEREGSASRRVA